MDDAKLKIEGSVEREIELGYDDLAALPGQIDDVGTVVPRREGAGVRVASILERAGVRPEATHLTIIAESGSFAASVPLAAVADAVLTYRLGDAALPAGKGGPLRFLIPDAAACHTAEVDTCANVKFVETLRVDVGRGEDTRPSSPREHHALHEKPGHERSS